MQINWIFLYHWNLRHQRIRVFESHSILNLSKIFKNVFYNIVLNMTECSLIKLCVLPIGHLLSQLSILINAAFRTTLYIATSQLLELGTVAIWATLHFETS